MKNWIKSIYLYLVSLIALIFIIVNTAILIDLGLKTWVFTAADNDIYYSAPPQPRPYLENNDSNAEIAKTLAEQEELTSEQKQEIDQWLTDYEEWQEKSGDTSEQAKANKQRRAASAIGYLIVAIPVFIYHWRLARKES